MRHPRILFGRQYWPMLGFVGLFAVVGTLLLFSSHAATPYTSVTANGGALAGGAAAQACGGSAAASGQCVAFNGVSSGGGGTTTGTPWIGLNNFTAWGGTYTSPYNSSVTTTYQNLYYSDGFRWARLEVTGSYAAGNSVDSALAAGLNVVLIVPENSTAAMTWMNAYKSYGSRIIFEFGNEPFYNNVSASTYAQAYKQTYDLKHCSGLTNCTPITQPLLFMTTGDLHGQGMWLEQSTSAVSGLQIDGFSAHTYDQATDDLNGHSNGVLGLVALHADAVNHGFTTQPWYVTEYGFTLCNPVSPPTNCPTTSSTASTWYVPSYYEQEKQTILGFDAMMPYGDGKSGTWLKGIMWYQTHDDGTGDFGLVTDTGTAKDNAGEQIGNQPSHSPICLRPAYTALKDFLTSNYVDPAIAVNTKAPACK